MLHHRLAAQADECLVQQPVGLHAAGIVILKIGKTPEGGGSLVFLGKLGSGTECFVLW